VVHISTCITQIVILEQPFLFWLLEVKNEISKSNKTFQSRDLTIQSRDLTFSTVELIRQFVVARTQGDQIGQIFARWVVLFFGQFFEN
jgi:hypothetical protein